MAGRPGWGEYDRGKEEVISLAIEVGDRVKFLKTAKENAPVHSGDVGKVWRVTPIGTLRVIWDNGSKFDLDPKSDQWEVMSNGHDRL